MKKIGILEMKKTGILAFVSLFVVASLVGPGFAASVHLKGGKNAEPSFTDNGLTLTADGDLAGLGSGDVNVTLTATANPTATCSNPSGANQPPGKNPAPVTVTGGESIPATEIQNGNVHFSVTTNAPVTPVPGAPDCTNGQGAWTESITDMSFTSATITVEQPPGTVVLTVSCTFNPPTSNGAVPASSVSCTSH
jgi:hypothetical protein